MNKVIKLSFVTALLITGANAINVAPFASFSCITDHNKVQCDASNSKDADGSITKYKWDFGDIYSSQDINATSSSGSVIATHTYSKAGSYTVKLTVVDNGGKSALSQQTITIQDYLPTINVLNCYFDSKGFSEKLNCNADVTNPSNNSMQWKWYVDNNLTSTIANNLSYTVSDFGNHTVELEVINDFGMKKSQPITVTNLNPEDYPTKKIVAGWGIYSDFQNKNETLGDLNNYVKDKIGKELVIWAYADGQWYTPYSNYQKYTQYYNTTKVIKNIDGFWMYSPEEYYIPVSPSLMPSYQTVSGSGWILIGNPIANAIPITSILTNDIINKGGAIAYRYSNNSWKMYNAQNSNFFSKDELNKFEGMWIHLNNTSETVSFDMLQKQDPLEYNLTIQPTPQNLKYSISLDVKDIDSKPTSYLWIIDNETTNAITTQLPFLTKQFDFAGEHKVFVKTVFDDNTSYEKSFTVNTNNLINSYVPQLNVNVANSNDNYKKINLTLEAYDKDGLKSVNVDFGDDTNETLILDNNQSITISHAYDKDGEYTLLVSATDMLGNTKKNTSIVNISNVLSAPTINDFNCSSSNGYEFNCDTNISDDYGIKSVNVDFGDDNSETYYPNSNDFSFSHIYKTSGLYTIKLTAINNQNIEKNVTTEAKVDIYDNPPVLNSFEQSSITGNTYVFEVNATAQDGKNIKEYDWDFGDGIVKATNNAKIAYTYNQSGSFLPSVKIIDDYGKYSIAYGNDVNISVGGFIFKTPDNITTDYQDKTFTLTGILTDNIGNPIADKNVTYSIGMDYFLKDSSNNSNGVATTDSNGVFTVDLKVSKNYIDANTSTSDRDTYIYLKHNTDNQAILFTQKGYTPAK